MSDFITQETTNLGLTAQDISLIIKTCSESGVASLKFGDLEVEFLKKLEPTAQAAWNYPEALSPANEIAGTPTTEDFKERLEEDERALREQQLAEMIITDPLQYEELLAAGELDELDASTPAN